ncbi:MAG: DUF554 domain-containing protein [Synergistaceae bacterium]|nr:DUF554 domain-containing protein [Synergistaceae bacterium]
MNFLSSIPAGGTVFNALTVIVGSLLGLFVGRFIPERLRGTVFNCLGLFSMALGLEMALKMSHPLAVLLSLILGAILGGLCRLDTRLNGLGDALKAKMRSANPRFTDGFVTATLLFCIGAMAIVGAFEDGLSRNPTLLVTKGVMDGISSILLSGSFGIGVLFSVIPMSLYQGGLTFLAVWAEPLLTPDRIADLSGLGGLMIVGIGLNLLGVAKLKLGDMLPALVLVPFLSWVFA